MKEFAFLKFLDKVSSVFQMNGIDYPIMRKILQIKFTMDERRVPTIMMNEKKQAEKNTFRSALIIYAIMGIVIGVFMFLPLPLFYKMNLITGMILFMLMTSMISDFSSVLLDVDDKNILLPKPINAKTLNTAKLIHIIVYLFSITMAISGGSLVFGLIRYGVVFFLLLLLEIILLCGFAILFTALFYYAILTIFSGEKLKDIINYFQIVLVTVMTIMYQLIGRIFDISNLNLNVTPHLWDFFLPSAWFSAPFKILIEMDTSWHYRSLSLIGLIVPLITVTLYVKVVAPRFEKKLQKLNSGGSVRQISLRKESFQRAVSNIICSHPIEKVFFRFTLQMMGNERKLKLKLYPNLAFAVILPLIFLLNFFNSNQSFAESFSEISNGKYYLMLYFSVAFLDSSFSMISSSENYKGAWIYKTLPIDNPGMVMRGAFKGFLYQYIIPAYLLISILFIAIFRLRVIPNLILIFLNLLLLMIAFFLFSQKELPFYKDFNIQNGNNLLNVMLSFIFCTVCAFVHYAAVAWIPYGLAINMGISLVLIVL
ncbi:MAG: ABC transporter permease, partial [Anaerovorax sp.]|nr:ABC transporter permease [Anaerovorax sp.]